MQVIIDDCEYQNLCEIRDKHFANIKTRQIYFSRNEYFCHGYACTDDKAFNKLIDINNNLASENAKLQKQLDYYKCRSFWNKFKDLWIN